MPDPGRPPEVSTLTLCELERIRRELQAGLALARPDSPARVPILAHVGAIDAELAGIFSASGAVAASILEPAVPAGGINASVRVAQQKMRH